MTTVNDFFLHNWADHSSLETSYLTDIVQTHAALTEERRALLSRPRRVLKAHWTGINQDEANRLLMEIMRGGVQQLLVPLYMDQSITTGGSSGTTIACDTTNRRFQIGGSVLIFSLDRNGRPSNPQVFQIDALGSGSITTHTAISGTYSTGAVAFPLMLAEVMLTSELQLVTDEVTDLALSFYELLSAGLTYSAVPGFPGPLGSQTSAANPAAAAATPILNVSPDYGTAPKIAATRVGSKYKTGRDSVIDTEGARPVLEHTFKLSFFDRPTAWAFLNFFDAAKGRLMPWWLVNPQTLYRQVGCGSGYVDVAVSGQLQNVTDFLEYVAVVMTDGTIYVRKVSGVALVGGNWRISAPLPALTFGNIARVTSAHFVRFAKDSVTLDYLTDGISSAQVETVEILAETADTDATQTTASNCFGPGEDCAGPWTVCYIAYTLNPRGVSFDCPQCLLGVGHVQYTLLPTDSCTVSLAVSLAYGDFRDGAFHVEAGACAGLATSVPIVLAETFGNYILVYSDGTNHVYANITRSLPRSPAACAYVGYILPDDRTGIPCPNIVVQEGWF